MKKSILAWRRQDCTQNSGPLTFFRNTSQVAKARSQLGRGSLFAYQLSCTGTSRLLRDVFQLPQKFWNIKVPEIFCCKVNSNWDKYAYLEVKFCSMHNNDEIEVVLFLSLWKSADLDVRQLHVMVKKRQKPWIHMKATCSWYCQSFLFQFPPQWHQNNKAYPNLTAQRLAGVNLAFKTALNVIFNSIKCIISIAKAVLHVISSFSESCTSCISRGNPSIWCY